MEWSQVVAIIGTNIGLIAIIGGFISWAFSKIDNDFSRVREDINKLDGDIKKLSEKIDANTKEQTQRTDQLYQMFIDLLKEKKI